jgi:hypothetical protein
MKTTIIKDRDKEERRETREDSERREMQRSKKGIM